MTHRLSSFAAAAAVASLVLGGPSQAAVSFVSRDVFVRIDGTADNFSDVSALFSSTYGVGAGSSGSRAFSSIPFPSVVSVSSSTSGAVSLTDVTYTLPSLITANVNATGPQGGTFTFDSTYAVLDGPEGDGPLFRYLRTGDASYAPAPFSNPNLTALELYLPIGASVDPGNPFTISFSIAGNYSTTASLDSGTGQYHLANLDPAWTITRNFVYDPVANQTTFSAVNPSFQTGQVPELDVYFLGAVAAVPEPAGWLSMAAGMALIFTGSRRRRCRRPAAAVAV